MANNILKFVLENGFGANSAKSTNFETENLFSTSSIQTKEYDIGLTSTQELNIDYSSFENHTFFNSAVVKTNIAFEKIINKYPFDGTKDEVIQYIDSLNGFEKYIFDQFPYNFGYLEFDGTQHIKINDIQGASEYVGLNKVNSGNSIIYPENINTSMTIEMHLMPFSASYNNSIILQKISTSNQDGLTIYSSGSNINDDFHIGLCISSGSNFCNVETTIKKDKFSLLSFLIDRSVDDITNISIYKNGETAVTASSNSTIGNIDIFSSNLLLASGSTFKLGFSGSFTPQNNYSGSIDELRIFHSLRTKKQINIYKDTNVFSTNELKLYYKFNESDDIAQNISDEINSIVLDSSGNSLHSNIENFSSSMRKNRENALNSILKNEKKEFNKVLFPGNSEIIALNEDTLETAKEYDIINPNLITKLIPRHYLIDGQLFEGFDLDNINSGDIKSINESSAPGQLTTNNVQMMLSFLYIYAGFFDELKTYLDSFTHINNIDYNSENTMSDVFLKRQFEINGLDFVKIINSKNLFEYFLGHYSLDDTGKFEFLPLKEIQNRLYRNILTNFNDIVNSKGTQESIKSLFRSIGIDPDSSTKFIEYGSFSRNLSDSKERRKIIDKMLVFSSSTSFITSSYLQSSRQELDLYDFPKPSNTINDNLLTSGSWTVQFSAKLFGSETDTYLNDSSLCRMYVTGSDIQNDEGCYLNLISNQKNKELKLVFNTNDSETNTLILSGSDIYDGEYWKISFGRIRGDQDKDNIVLNKSKYFLQAGKFNNYFDITNYHTASWFADDESSTGVKILNEFSSSLNSSGSYLVIGNGKNQNSTQTKFLTNSIDLVASIDFRISQFLFFSKEVTNDNFIQNIQNPLSYGTENPIISTFKSLNHSASFERIRLNCINRLQSTESDNTGNIILNDITKNDLNFSGFGFEPNKQILIPEPLYYSCIPSNIDEPISNKIIYVDSDFEFNTYENINNEIENDNRFEIKISAVDSLSEDIIRTFSDTQFIQDSLGKEEDAFNLTYKNFDFYSNIYFDIVDEKINFKKFFDFLRIFDLSINKLIENLIPKKTNFKGLNYPIEQHILERYKIKYKVPNFYSHKSENIDFNLLNQFEGVIKNA